jgi:hypothetical protein
MTLKIKFNSNDDKKKSLKEIKEKSFGKIGKMFTKGHIFKDNFLFFLIHETVFIKF